MTRLDGIEMEPSRDVEWAPCYSTKWTIRSVLLLGAVSGHGLSRPSLTGGGPQGGHYYRETFPKAFASAANALAI